MTSMPPHPDATPDAAPGTPTLVLIGHGMVGQRFLEELADRGVTGRARVVVLCEEPRPAYDRVQLTSYFAGRTPDDLSLVDAGLHGPARHRTAPRRPGRRPSTATRPHGHRPLRPDRRATTPWCWPPARTRSCRRCPARTARAASSTAPSRTCSPSRSTRRHARTGVVVGGGLLGLEAAGALKGLGLPPTSWSSAPRLMALQVDEGGGAALRRTVEGMGLSVHTGVGGKEIVADEAGAVTAMGLSDGSRIDTDLVVFSAGVRPRDQLARGLRAAGRRARRHRRRRAVPHRSTPPSTRSASARWPRTAGSTGWSRRATTWPEWRPAPRRAARRRTGARTGFTGADLSTKLKLLGVDVASFGDAHGTADGCSGRGLLRLPQRRLQEAGDRRRRRAAGRRAGRRRRGVRHAARR